jgi:hypothetical protein
MSVGVMEARDPGRGDRFDWILWRDELAGQRPLAIESLGRAGVLGGMRQYEVGLRPELAGAMARVLNMTGYVGIEHQQDIPND